MVFLAITDYFKKFNEYISFFDLFVFSAAVSVFLLIADYRDFPSKIIIYISENIAVTVLWLGIFLLLLWGLKVRFINYLTMPIPIALDCFLIVMFTAGLVYGTRTFALEHVFSKKLFWNCIILSSSLSILIIRILCCIKTQYDDYRASQNVYDLKNIYENNFLYKGRGPILLKEDAVDYDLLNRRSIINHICSTIESCQHGSSFVVGLEGAWGSGKTTIINNVKQKLNETDNIVIDDFDPWLYGSQEALLLAMFDAILENTGIKYSAIKIKSIVNDLLDTVAENYKAGGIIKTFISKYNKANINGIKDRINSYLNKSNKNIVFIIDNIDRADSSNIIFLFKLIGIVFDIPRIVYVLSYDRKRLNAVFENTLDIDKKYTEKIIQQEISIPQIQLDRLRELYFACLENILRKYGLDDIELLEYIHIINCICEKVKDVRNLKRLVNSSFSTVFSGQTILNKKDLLSLEIIKFTEPDLYDSIYKNRKYFISYDRNLDVYMKNVFFNAEDFNEEGKAFFKQLLNIYPEYMSVLMDMFPYVSRYNQGDDLEYNKFSQEDYSEAIRNARISSARFFDLYFSYGSNNSLMIEKDISETITKIEKTSSFNDCIKFIKEKITSMDNQIMNDWFAALQLYTSNFSESLKDRITFSIFYNINLIGNQTEDNTYSARQRAFVIVSNHINDCSFYFVRQLMDANIEKYDNLKYIKILVDFLKKNSDTSQNSISYRKSAYLMQKLTEMCYNISSQKINLYSDSYYCENNIWILKNAISGFMFTNYMKSVAQSNNIYRIINDTIRYKSSVYYIDRHLINYMFLDKKDVDRLIAENPPKTESEMFVFNVYNNFRHPENETLTDADILKPKKFSL